MKKCHEDHESLKHMEACKNWENAWYIIEEELVSNVRSIEEEDEKFLDIKAPWTWFDDFIRSWRMLEL